jgi:hypothetical protein
MRQLIAIVASALLLAAAAGPVSADSGAPGSTYPEQPGNNVQNACATILSSPSQAGSNQSSVAGTILNGLLVDACFGG